MEYCNIYVTDITYLSELIPAASLCEAKRRGLIRPASCILQECGGAH